MQFPTNTPIVLATKASSFNSVTVVAALDPATAPNPHFSGSPYAGPTLPADSYLTINDAAALADASDDNALWSIAWPDLFANCLHKGPITGSGTTSDGLVVSSVPPGVAIIVDFG